MNTTAVERDWETIRKYMTEISMDLEEALMIACRKADEEHALKILPRLVKAHKAREVSERNAAAVSSHPDHAAYCISSLFVKDAFFALSGAPEEDLRLATGIKLGPEDYALFRLLRIKLSAKTMVYAKGDDVSMNRVLIQLHQYDHLLLAVFHIHPGFGRNANHPSGIDLDMQKRWESGKYPLIGGIFSRDGYLRFFSDKRRFKISIYGKGVEVIDEDESLYKLTDLNPVQG